MAKIREREIALKLRKQGSSIGDIAKEICVSKSTVSHWCKDIELTDSALIRISKRSEAKSTLALLRYSESRRKTRLADIERASLVGAKMIGELTERDIFCIGLGLYWGEGYKKGGQEFGFTNSDSTMIMFYIKWLKVVFDVEKKDLILRISINSSHEHRVAKVLKYWSLKTKIPESQFTKTSLIKAQAKKQYGHSEDHYGTLRIKVRRGTQFRRQVLGAIGAVHKNV
ncbi:MAG: putative transcriptional regulator [Candidatus Azotimanducaceae bacterium]|jgi:predicted transcriptional regulator